MPLGRYPHNDCHPSSRTATLCTVSCMGAVRPDKGSPSMGITNRVSAAPDASVAGPVELQLVLKTVVGNTSVFRGEYPSNEQVGHLA